ncbi:hypothetical protein [Faecalibacillus intestinalis]|uniref:hypothetical protein n=1 Tax=Faecalibacillus intestinalis TaxID=1982626 RepID=UPI00352153A8
MIVHGTATAIGNYLKKMDSSLKDDEVILMTYFFIKKDYDLIFEDAEVDSNLEKNLLMKSSEQTVQTATGRYKYSVSIEDLYIGVFKALAKAIIGNIGDNVTKGAIFSSGLDIIEILRKVIYKIKDDEKCIYMFVCENMPVLKEKIMSTFVNQKCYYSTNKQVCNKCKNKHSSKSQCKMTKEDIDNILSNLKEVNAIKEDENKDGKKEFSCVF